MEMIANIFAFPINGFTYFFLLAYNYEQYITETNLIFRLEGCLSHVYILYGRLLWKYKILRIVFLGTYLPSYCSLCIAFSCIWSICCWEISSNRLHQSLPEIIRLNFLSSGWTHLPLVSMSALIGSDGENHLHDKQFSDCHVIRFNVFLVSPAVVVI